MPRRVQDIVPATKRSIRNITIDRDEPAPKVTTSKTRTKKSTRTSDPPATQNIPVREIDENETPLIYVKDKQELAPIDEDVEKLSIKRMPITPPPSSMRLSTPRKSWKWVVITVVVVAVILVGAYVASTKFSRATFTIVPKVLPVAINSTYVAQHTSGNSGLTYDLVSVSTGATSTVAATDGANVSAKAQGKIVLYNANSTSGVRLIAGTRLSDTTGRIYRLTGSIVIPGMSGTGTAVKPGSVATTVVADQPGQQFNISRSENIGTLKIVAYKGSAKYDTVYATLSTDITGGYLGTKKTVSPVVLASTTATLKSQISTALAGEIATRIPAGYVFYPNATVTSYSAAQISGSDPKKATISMTGTAYGVIFPKVALVDQLVGAQAVATFNGFTFDTPGLDTLDVTLVNAKDFSPQRKNNLIVKIKGNFKLIGIIPVDELKRKFAGVSLAETQKILAPYGPVIQTGSGELVPPWAKVPTDQSRITITVSN